MTIVRLVFTVMILVFEPLVLGSSRKRPGGYLPDHTAHALGAIDGKFDRRSGLCGREPWVKVLTEECPSGGFDPWP